MFWLAKLSPKLLPNIEPNKNPIFEPIKFDKLLKLLKLLINGLILDKSLGIFILVIDKLRLLNERGQI